MRDNSGGITTGGVWGKPSPEAVMLDFDALPHWARRVVAYAGFDVAVSAVRRDVDSGKLTRPEPLERALDLTSARMHSNLFPGINSF